MSKNLGKREEETHYIKVYWEVNTLTIVKAK